MYISNDQIGSGTKEGIWSRTVGTSFNAGFKLGPTISPALPRTSIAWVRFRFLDTDRAPLPRPYSGPSSRNLFTSTKPTFMWQKHLCSTFPLHLRKILTGESALLCKGLMTRTFGEVHNINNIMLVGVILLCLVPC